MNDHFILAKLGARIKELRISSDLTQDQLSLESDIEKAMISKIESGRTNPTVRTLNKISVALDVSIADFFKD